MILNNILDSIDQSSEGEDRNIPRRTPPVVAEVDGGKWSLLSMYDGQTDKAAPAQVLAVENPDDVQEDTACGLSAGYNQTDHDLLPIQPENRGAGITLRKHAVKEGADDGLRDMFRRIAQPKKRPERQGLDRPVESGSLFDRFKKR